MIFYNANLGAAGEIKCLSNYSTWIREQRVGGKIPLKFTIYAVKVLQSPVQSRPETDMRLEVQHKFYNKLRRLIAQLDFTINGQFSRGRDTYQGAYIDKHICAHVHGWV